MPNTQAMKIIAAASAGFPSRGLVLAGVSGGADSLALLEALAAGLPGADRRLVAVHVHHGLRGRAADRDLAWVLSRCRQLGVPCVVYRRAVAAEARRRGRTLEDAGREIRQECFLDAARLFKASAVALAHHRDDQAETLLLHLLRGAAGRGLAGLRADRPFPHPQAPAGLRLVRPLLAFSKSDLSEFLRGRGVGWREDRSNQDPAFTRNRIRLRVLPYLERELGLPVKALLARSAEILAREDDYLQTRARTLTAGLPEPRPGRRLRWPLARLRACPSALQGRVLGLAWDGCRIPGKSAEHLAALGGLRSGAVRVLPGGWRARAAGRTFELIPPLAVRADANSDLVHLFSLPGVEMRTVPVPDNPKAVPRGAAFALVDAARLDGSLRAGFRRAGESMQPLGLGGRSKPLKKILAEMKIPAHLRGRWPIIRVKSRVLWVFRGPVADWAQVTPATRQAVEIRLASPAGGSGKPFDIKGNSGRGKPRRRP